MAFLYLKDILRTERYVVEQLVLLEVVIGLGDNNLRPKGLKSGFSVDDVIRCHQNVVQLVSSIERLSLDPFFLCKTVQII
jgi:hypothetical protein